ncbi:MAG: hypothetical protein V3T23_13660, partial [Nitrososphaerales archaeon]
EEEPNLTPEEQETYESAMSMIGELIYTNDESSKAIIDMMGQGEPADAVSGAAMFLMGSIEQTFKGNYPEELILPTMDEATDVLMELGDEAGVFEITEDLVMDVKSKVVQALMEEYGVDPEDMQAQLGDVTEADVADMESAFGGNNGQSV